MTFPNRETMFQPGQSGNPKGRPKAVLATALRARLDLMGDDGQSVAERLAQGLIDLALSGDIHAIREVFNRVDGKVCKAADDREPLYGDGELRPRIVIPGRDERWDNAAQSGAGDGV